MFRTGALVGRRVGEALSLARLASEQAVQVRTLLVSGALRSEKRESGRGVQLAAGRGLHREAGAAQRRGRVTRGARTSTHRLDDVALRALHSESSGGDARRKAASWGR